ncbi:hypothetical protein B566_EDAN016799 [Ephemera danica]|nr:hypothetical protein B566_EDAN016799 [Ephemera danica]
MGFKVVRRINAHQNQFGSLSIEVENCVPQEGNVTAIASFVVMPVNENNKQCEGLQMCFEAAQCPFEKFPSPFGGEHVLATLKDGDNDIRVYLPSRVCADLFGDEDIATYNAGMPCLTVTKKKPLYSVGDYVLVAKEKGTFGKGYEPGWREEVFRIKRVQRGDPITYALQDLMGEDITGIRVTYGVIARAL